MTTEPRRIPRRNLILKYMFDCVFFEIEGTGSEVGRVLYYSEDFLKCSPMKFGSYYVAPRDVFMTLHCNFPHNVFGCFSKLSK